MGKVYMRFQTKTAQKPYPMGTHMLSGLYKGVPAPTPPHPPPPPKGREGTIDISILFSLYQTLR